MKLSDSIVCFLMAGSICACLDLSPLRYVEPGRHEKDAGAGNTPDAGDDDAGAEDAGPNPMIEPCRMCLAASCGTQAERCNADPKCSLFAMCMTDTVCWGTSLADINNVDPCITACGQQAGLMSQVDPAAALLVPLLLCAQNPSMCASTCAPDLIK